MTRGGDLRVSTIVSPLDDTGWQAGVTWATREQAQRLAERLDGQGEVIPNPHLTVPDINALVRERAIVNAVAGVIGPNIAIEGGFLLSKQPGADFPVPWHQDGISDRGELDPARAVTLWAALTDATVEAGALEVISGSWKHGYLPYRREPADDSQRGRALMTDVPDGSPSP